MIVWICGVVVGVCGIGCLIFSAMTMFETGRQRAYATQRAYQARTKR